MPRQLKNLRIDEVSSVDRGAGKGVNVLLLKRFTPDQFYTSIEKGDLADVVIEYLKREFSADERRSAASSGAALPDGSFPIKNKSDLSNAIRAIGRAKDPAKAKAHIKSRARALGASDMLPDSWSKRDEDTALKALALTIETVLGDTSNDAAAKSASLVETFKQFHSYLDGDEPASQENDMTITVDADALNKLIEAGVEKSLEKLGIKKMTAEHAAYHSNLDGDEAKKFGSMSHDERDKYVKDHPHSDDDADPEPTGDGDEKDQKEAAEKMAKALVAAGLSEEVAKAMSLQIVKAAKKKKKGTQDTEEEGDDEPDTGARKLAGELKKRDDTIATLKKQLDTLTEKDQRVEFGKRAVAIGLAETDGELLLKVHRGDPEAIKKVEDRIKALNEQIAKGQLFGEFGDRRGGAGGTTAHDQLVERASALRKAHPELKLTAEQAYVKVMEDPENAEIVELEKRERNQRINKAAA